MTKAGREALVAYNKRLRAQMHALEVLAEAERPLSGEELASVQVSAATLRILCEKAGANGVSNVFCATAMPTGRS